MRLELDKLLPERLSRPLEAPWEHLGPDQPNPDVIGPLEFSPLLEYDDDDLQSSKEQLGLDQCYQTLRYISELKCHM